MNIDRIDISRFERSSDFYDDIDLLLTVKSFDLQAIRQRYLKSKQSGKGKVGSAARREMAIGGLVSAKLSKGNLHNPLVHARLKEPRGICMHEEAFAFSAEKDVYVIQDRAVRKLNHPWFSYIHTLDILNDRLLVASSGYDCIFQFDLNSLEQTNEWFAWENGFDEGTEPKQGRPIILTRQEQVYKDLAAAGRLVKYIHNPEQDSLPTSMRSAFINSVCYDQNRQDKIIATFFHEGAIFAIDQHSGASERLISDLKTPHGGRSFGKGYMATSTGSGEVVVQHDEKQKRFQFSKLSGKPEVLGDHEWLQNSAVINDLIVTIDSNRTSFVIFNPQRELIDIIPYNDNWAIQDLVTGTLNRSDFELIAELNQTEIR